MKQSDRTSILQFILFLFITIFFLSSITTAQITNKVEVEPTTLEELTPGLIDGQVYYTPETGRVRFRLVCQEETCSIVKGATGANLCINHEGCKVLKYVGYRKYPTRLGCRDEQCVILWEEGESTCKTREDCVLREEVEEEEKEVIIEPIVEAPKPPPRPIYKIIKLVRQDSLFESFLKWAGWKS